MKTHTKVGVKCSKLVMYDYPSDQVVVKEYDHFITTEEGRQEARNMQLTFVRKTDELKILLVPNTKLIKHGKEEI